jgi:hypothetical protein
MLSLLLLLRRLRLLGICCTNAFNKKTSFFVIRIKLFTYEKCRVESIDKLRVEMDEMSLMYLEKVIDVLDEQVELMGIKLDEKKVKILFDVGVLLVFEHTLFDKVYTNFFHLLNCLVYVELKLKLQIRRIDYE